MTKRMLIDASHPEETRVVIVDGTRVEELDFESAAKRQLRGNLYLARVTRVEPSLQAAFVEYGGNRHGFLAFSEIHPDYYQIPYEDRMALLEEEEAESQDDADDDADDNTSQDNSSDEEAVSADEADVAEEQENTAEQRRRRLRKRRYKIQEVIKRGQILLIQVVKEERGNKGAAMTTYLSLAGRYCVLMPNTPRGGGISRKISNGSDRKRLKKIMSDLDVSQGMGVIVRTAGASRTKAEIKRDYEYLCRLWETIRETTLKSIAPSLIHEEGNLVKRSIRDLYNKDIKEVLVQGDEAYKIGKAFIKMLMPSHARHVKAYKDPIPLFLRYQVEKQIESSLDSVVQLKSGGYLVIHPTEALVSIDINSGRSTKERNVERTALKTNLEAADEIARQMRLRDLAGLIVIDFIDMDEYRNNRSVEKRMRDALAQDRARVQAGKISQFGLMEISRQRRRRSLLEGSTESCPHCDGVGRKLTVESVALRALRAVEDIGARAQAKRLRLSINPDVAAYIFNHKRALLSDIETRFDLTCEILAQPEFMRVDHSIETLETRDGKNEDPLDAIEKELRKEAEADRKKAKSTPKKSTSKKSSSKSSKKTADEDTNDNDSKQSKSDSSDKEEDGGTRKRRRGRRGGRRRKSESNSSESKSSDSKYSEDTSQKNAKSNQSDDKTDEKSDATMAALEVIDPAETTEKPKRTSRNRRKAPTKKVEEPKETSTAESDDKADAAKTEDAPRSTVRRKAPSKPKTKAKPKAKAAPKRAPARKSVSEVPSRSSTRRKAPAKKPAPDAVVPEVQETVSHKIEKNPETTSVDGNDTSKADKKTKGKKKNWLEKTLGL